MQRGDWYLERRWPFFLQQTRGFSGWQPCWPSFAAPCPEASGGERQGAEAGRRALFLHEKAGPWLRYGLAAAGCILLGFGRMKLEIRERVLEEQAAAERGEEPLVIEGQVEEIGETDYGYRLMVSGCEENGPESPQDPPAHVLLYGSGRWTENRNEDPGRGDHGGSGAGTESRRLRSQVRSAGRRGSAGSSGQTGLHRRAPDTAGSGKGSARYGSGWKDAWTS